MRERFRREAEVTARLSHENVVRIHGSGQVRGHPYIVYELIEGGRTLKDALASEPLERRLDLVEGVAAGLAAAHAAGVVHRDLKPENVLMRPSGEPVVVDFGLAALNSSSLTKTGQLLGTPAFMAPEQVRGEEVTPRTDVWALGLVLYEALYQRHAIGGEGALIALLAQICAGEVEFPRGAPPALRALVKACVAVDPSQRPPDAGALLAALRAARSPDPRRRLGVLLAILILLGALALSLTVQVVSSREVVSSSPSPRASAQATAPPRFAASSPTRAARPRAPQAWSHGLQGVRSACFLGDRVVMATLEQVVLFDRKGEVLRRFPGRYELLRAGPAGAWFVDQTRTYRLATSQEGLEEVWPAPALDCDPSSAEVLVRSGEVVEVRRRDRTLARSLRLTEGARKISGFLTPSHVFVSVHQPTLNLIALRGQGQPGLGVYLRLVTRLTAITASADRKQLAIGNADGFVFLTPSSELSQDLASLEPGHAKVGGYRRLSEAHRSPVGQLLFHERDLISVGHAKRQRETKAVRWNSQTYEPLATREGGTFTALALSESGLVAVVTPFEVSFVPIEDFR